MAQARPLHDILAGLAHEAEPAAGGTEMPAPAPADVLAESGHADLPDALLAEAIVSYADTAPAEVAEHLAPFVTSHTLVPTVDPAATGLDPVDGFALLTTAPAPEPAQFAEPEPAEVGREVEAALLDHPGSGDAEFGTGEEAWPGADPADPFDLEFGEGSGSTSAAEHAGGFDAELPGVLEAFDPVPSEPGADIVALSPTHPEPTEPEPVEPDPSQPDPVQPGPDVPGPADPPGGDLQAG